MSVAAPVRDTAPATAAGDAQPRATGQSTAAQHIRGSSLLLAGRVVAQALDLGAQVLLVRYLSKPDYGAFSYALAIALACKNLALFDLPPALLRYVPLYRERKQYNALAGSIALAIAFVVGLGTLLAVAIDAGLLVFGLRPTHDQQALRLLAVLALLIPVEALDSLLTALFASRGNSRMIFVRQSIVTPALRLALVLALISLGAPVLWLAVGYLLVSAAGVSIYAWQLRPKLALRVRRWHQLVYPARDLFGFATPLLAAEAVWLVAQSADALLLEFFRGSEAVADFRAVLPIANLNGGVGLTCALLYAPLAAGLYARNEHAELSVLYRHTALWMMVLTFPVFLLTFSFAHSVTIGMFGRHYASAAPVLMLLSLGNFFDVSLGLNGLTLKVYGKVRYAVALDVTAAALGIVACFALAPRWGAVGVAVAMAGMAAVHNVLKQYGLWWKTGITIDWRSYLSTIGLLMGLALALLALQATVLPASIWVALPLSAATGLLVLWSHRHRLDLETMFPELTRWPIIRNFVRPVVGTP